jgi:hypothetical protein
VSSEPAAPSDWSPQTASEVLLPTLFDLSILNPVQNVRHLPGSYPRVGILPSPPLTWLLIGAGAIGFDSPYARGIEPPDNVDAIFEFAATIPDWLSSRLGSFNLFTVDTRIARFAEYGLRASPGNGGPSSLRPFSPRPTQSLCSFRDEAIAQLRIC